MAQRKPQTGETSKPTRGPSTARRPTARRPTAERPSPGPVVQRVQTGVRMEKRLLKVLKALAEYHDLTLGDLLEGIVLHAFDGKLPFGEPSLEVIARLKKIYGLELGAADSHRLVEKTS